MKRLTQKTIDVIQWVFIVCLTAMLAFQIYNYQKVKKELISRIEYNRHNTYVRIHESQKLDKLKRENRELYDSISKLQDVESGMVIKFVERYRTDTITVDRFVAMNDTTNDTIYCYDEDNDTVKLSVKLKANDLKWLNADISIKDKFMIINREKDGLNETIVNHSSNATIDGTTMWHRKDKKKWYQNFVVGPQVGIGYGIINKNVDVYVGVGVTYNF